MRHSSAGWLLAAEFGIAFVAGVVGALVASHRHAVPAGAPRPELDASERVAQPDLQPVS